MRALSGGVVLVLLLVVLVELYWLGESVFFSDFSLGRDVGVHWS